MIDCLYQLVLLMLLIESTAASFKEATRLLLTTLFTAIRLKIFGVFLIVPTVALARLHIGIFRALSKAFFKDLLKNFSVILQYFSP